MNASLPAGIETYLKEAGFSATEMLLLRHLLEEAYTLRELAAKTGKSTGVLDQAMKKLLAKGIVEKKVVNEHPRYFIRSLNAVTDWVNRDVKERKEVLERRHKSFEQFIASLQVDRKNPDMEYFHGWEGIEKAYSQLLETGKELLTITPVLWRAEDDPLRDFRVQYFRKRQWGKIFQRVIAPDSLLSARFQSRDPFEYRRTLLVPEAELPISFEKTIVNGTIACIDFRDQTACFIRFPELAKSEAAAFEIAWARALARERGQIQEPLLVPPPVPTKTQMLSKFRMFILSKHSLVAFGIFAVMAGALTFGLYKYNRSLNEQRLHEKVLSIASTGALQFDAKDVDAIWTPEDIVKPEYAKLIATLNLIRRSNKDIKYAYIMRKTDDPSYMAFVADADSLNPNEKRDVNGDGVIDDADALNTPGEPYLDIYPPKLREGLNHPVSGIGTDQWGTLLSAQAPIRTSEGVAVAILGIDMYASEIDRLTAQTFSPVLLFFGLFVLFILVRFGALNRSLLAEVLKTLRPKIRLIALSVIFFLLCIYSTISLFRWHTRQLLIREAGERLMAIAVTAADDFDPEDLEQLHWARDIKTEEYQKIFKKLNEIRNINQGISFAYMVRPTEAPDLFEFVVDSDLNYNLPLYSKASIGDLSPFNEADESVWPGVIYDDSQHHAFSRALKKPAWTFIPVDQWGSSISGCAPVFFLNGQLSAIVCFDINVNDLTFINK